MPQSPESFQDEIAASFGRQAEILARIYALEDVALLRNPPAGGWNAAECLEHLSLTYEHYLPQLTLASQTEAHGNARYHTSWLMHRVIDGVRPRTTGRPRFKMKTFRITDPAPIEYTPRKTLERFGLLHIKFQHIAGVMDTPLKLNHRVVTLAGPWLRFKTGDAIKFLLAHNDRHLKQATRAIQDPGRQTHLFF